MPGGRRRQEGALRHDCRRNAIRRVLDADLILRHGIVEAHSVMDGQSSGTVLDGYQKTAAGKHEGDSIAAGSDRLNLGMRREVIDLRPRALPAGTRQGRTCFKTVRGRIQLDKEFLVDQVDTSRLGRNTPGAKQYDHVKGDAVHLCSIAARR